MNNLGRFGRWAFAEFTAVYEIEARFNQLIEICCSKRKLLNELEE